MIAAALASAVLAALPEGSVRYRAELAGEAVGVAELRIACAGATCEAAYESRLRAPAETGGAVQRTRVEVEVDRAGRYRGGALRVVQGGGEPRAPAGVPGAVPAALVEVVLGATAAGPERCVPFFREGSAAATATACGRAGGGEILADVGGVRVRIVPGGDGFPAEVVVLGRFRFARDAAAAVPARAPRLAGTRVAGPADPRAARAFCGASPDPSARFPADAALPPPRAAGESCREKTAAWLAAARARGLDGRTAVGVAWDGSGFVWHAWAEVRSGGAWIPVDPSFGELPARGPRFTLGRFTEADEPAREAAGARILACWGNAHVEGPR